jgi:glycosyltransferase involved in cell wall biosynthesis
MSSLPEVAGDAALYFDPKNEESIYQAVKLILNDELLRKSLIEKGTQRLTNFSWKKAAEKTLDTYKSIL